MSERRIFYAHAAGQERSSIEDCATDLAAALQVRAGRGTYIKVTSGIEDYNKRFPLCGGWDCWTASVGSGHAYDGSPLYHGIVVPTEQVGKATAGIIQAALDAGRPVLYWQRRERIFRPIKGVERTGESWKSGWTIQPDGTTVA
tara:strand:+ start:1049 stop:1480 length:432 start_codon:yes stop_codon:yes gene_type:complete